MTEPVYDRFGVRVFHGNNLDVLRAMPDCSVDSIVTDPPAGIGFLREWDSDRGGRDAWVDWLTVRMLEAHRVLKPGGHALVWALPRTSHWTGLALEDARFEIRDVVQHAYEGGFPKSLDVAKAIDRARDDRAEVNVVTEWLAEQRDRAGLTNRQIDEAFGFHGMAGHWTAGARLKIAQCPRPDQWEKLRDLIGFGDDMDTLVARLNGRKGTAGEAWDTAEVLFTQARMNEPSGVVNIGQGQRTAVTRFIKAANSDAARQWTGWGTALRPAAEPWWLVRKPLEAPTVAASVQVHGTGAINIDAARGPDGQWPANVAKFPKAPPSERPMVNGEQHPTVKSVALCRWLVRLVTPPDGVVLDLFAGTGSVGQAARAEGKRAILIEQDEQSIGFIRARLDARPKTQAGAAADDGQPVDLLDLLGGDAS